MKIFFDDFCLEHKHYCTSQKQVLFADINGERRVPGMDRAVQERGVRYCSREMTRKIEEVIISVDEDGIFRGSGKLFGDFGLDLWSMVLDHS